MRVDDPLGVRAAVALELGLDPVDRLAIAFRALPAIAERGQPFDRGLVFLEVESIDHDLDGIDGTGRRGRRRALRLGLSGGRARKATGETRGQQDRNPAHAE
jgi:hypothetical protein